MAETTAAPMFRVPTQDQLNQMVDQQFKSAYENTPDVYFHAWQEQGVHARAVEDQEAVLDLDPNQDTKIDVSLWEEEMKQPEARPNVMMSKEEVIAFTLPAGRNLIYERRLANLN